MFYSNIASYILVIKTDALVKQIITNHMLTIYLLLITTHTKNEEVLFFGRSSGVRISCC